MQFKEVAHVLGLPAHLRPVAIVPVGTPAEKLTGLPSRKPLDTVVHFDF